MNPPLKWAGGKRWLVPLLKVYYSYYPAARFVELFAGGASATFAIAPQTALLNDTLFPLINFYRHLRNGLTAPPLASEEAAFLAARERFNQISNTDSVESAQLFYYLNRTCFNGLCRFNADGQFNTSFGGGTYNTLRPLEDYRNALAGVDITHGDFAAGALVLSDFVYADPPYDDTFTAYSPGGFSWDDQVRLVTWLDQHAGPIVLSNAATDRIIKLYREAGYHLTFQDVRRSISCDGDRTPVREVVATKQLTDHMGVFA